MISAGSIAQGPLPLAAVITAGGASRRFGSDKALAVLDGQTLLERVALSLPDCSPRLLVAPPGKYALGGWQTVSDTRPGEGPLAGLEAGLGALEHLSVPLMCRYPLSGCTPPIPLPSALASISLAPLGHKSLATFTTNIPNPGTWTAFSAVDLPHLTPQFWLRLFEFVWPGVQAVIGLSADGRRQPLAALYHTSALREVTALLDAGERRMLTMLERLSVTEVSWANLESAAPRAYQNVNRVEDLG